MVWVFLQVVLAFGVAVAIVWWTWPKAPETPKAAKVAGPVDAQKPSDVASSEKAAAGHEKADDARR